MKRCICGLILVLALTGCSTGESRSSETTVSADRTVKIDISAGFTPLILVACAIVSGLIFSSFCLASLAKFLILL